MADLKMNQFPDGQLSDTQMLVGYDPYAAASGERKYSAVNLVSYLTGALPFIGNANPTINGILTLNGDIHFSGGAIVTSLGDLYQVGRGKWLSADMAKLDDAWNKASAAQSAADQAAVSAAQAATSASSASANAATASSAATTATQAQTSASGSATAAQAWASQPTGTVQGTSSYSSLYYAGQSQYWAGISQAMVAAPTTFDPGYKHSSITLSNGNLTATFGGSQAVVLGTIGYASGKHYFEVTFASGSNSGNASVGIAPSNEPLDSQVGYDDDSGAVGAFQTSGNVYVNGSKVASVSGFASANDVIGVAVDADRKLVWFRSNTGQWNASATADPVSGTGGIPYTQTGKMFPAVCTDSSAVFTANFSGNFNATIPTGFKAWAADAFHYVVPYATTSTPGVVVAGSGVSVDSYGKLSVDTYYDIVSIQAQDTINIDLTSPVPGYHVVLNSPDATFAFTNLQLPAGKALRLTFYFEQGTGNNTISSWDSRIKWVGSRPIFAYTVGSRNVIELETIDGQTFSGFYVGQIN
ncbi:SPRY domain-containing protein [Burkholderia multivorans]|uniref:SPRY domain-containing protein n=1 Tax=Burkholderia multivorans TaxID=87883 RepID=UPI001FC8D40A|nr:SPRY domain-containing protein [Burkholderia multivorans]